MENLIPLKFINQMGGYLHNKVGIPNLGQFCFANAFLQTLYSSKIIRDAVIDFDENNLLTEEEFRDNFRGMNLYEMPSYIDLPLEDLLEGKKFVFEDYPDFDLGELEPNRPFYKILIVKLNDINITDKTKFRIWIEGYQADILDISYNIGICNIILYISENGGNSPNLDALNNLGSDKIKLKLYYTDLFKTYEIITDDALKTKLEWFSSDNIQRGDLIQIMRFKYLKDLFNLIHANVSGTLLEDDFSNLIKGIVGTIVSYFIGDNIDQNDSGEILLNLMSVLERILDKSNFLKQISLQKFYIKNEHNETVVKIKINPNHQLVNNLISNENCYETKCNLKDVFPIFKNEVEFEELANSRENIDKLDFTDGNQWGRLRMDDELKENIKSKVGENESLLCVSDDEYEDTGETNAMGLTLKAPKKPCMFYKKSDLATKNYLCVFNLDIKVLSNPENPPQILLLHNSRTGVGHIDDTEIEYNFYETFFGKHYMLTGLTYHSGGKSIASGHYVSKVKSEDKNFYEMNDASVKLIDNREMLNNKKKWTLLVYERVTDLQQIIIDCNS